MASKTPQQINLIKLRKLAENQKKTKVAAAKAPVPAASAGFKIHVVDENGVQSGEFSDIGHMKFETAKGPAVRLRDGGLHVPSSKEEAKLLMTDERQMFVT